MTDPLTGHGIASVADQRRADDARLLARMAAGDERALGSLYDTYGAAVYGLALAITQDPERAEAAVADAFATVWREARQAAADSTPVLVHLTTAARRAALASRATAGVTSAAPLSAHTLLASGALEQLSPSQRQAVELAWFRGLSRAEIAHTMGEPEATVGTYLRTGLDVLRHSLTSGVTSPVAVSA